MIDASPALLIRAAAHLAGAVATRLPQFPRQMRFGASAGVVNFEETEMGKSLKPRGLALLRAARLEPFGFPGTILADCHFMEGAIEFGVEQTTFQLLKSVDLPTLQIDDGLFVVSKPDERDKILSALWRVDLCAKDQSKHT